MIKQLPVVRNLVRQRDALLQERLALLGERDRVRGDLEYIRGERDAALARLGQRRSAEMTGVDTIDAVRGRHPDFEQVRDRVRAAGTYLLAHFGNGYTHEGGLFLQQNPDEFASLLLFLRERRPHANYLEIGTASGGACLLLQREVGFATIVSLDDGQHPLASEQPRILRQLEHLGQFVGDSHSDDARRFLEDNLPGPLDVAFIDGDHSYEGVRQDLQLALQFSRPGTILIFHDTVACEGVERAWTEGIREGLIRPAAEYIGHPKPLGIGVGTAPCRDRSGPLVQGHS